MRIEEIPNGGDLSRFLRTYAALSQEDRAELRPLLAPQWGLLDWLSMRTPPLVGTMAEVMQICGSQEEWQRVLAAQEHVLTDPEFCRAVRVEWPLPEDGLLWGTVALLNGAQTHAAGAVRDSLRALGKQDSVRQHSGGAELGEPLTSRAAA